MIITQTYVLVKEQKKMEEMTNVKPFAIMFLSIFFLKVQVDKHVSECREIFLANYICIMHLQGKKVNLSVIFLSETLYFVSFWRYSMETLHRAVRDDN